MDIQGMCAEALDQLVREVAARVVASIKAQQDQALVVYTGAKIGCATATEQLAQLRERLGLSYTVLMSESAARVLDVDAIDEALKPADLVIERSGSKSAESMARAAGLHDRLGRAGGHRRGNRPWTRRGGLHQRVLPRQRRSRQARFLVSRFHGGAHAREHGGPALVRREPHDV